MHYWKKLTTLQKALAAIVVVVLFAIGVMSARAEGVDRAPPSFLPIGEVAKATTAWTGVYMGAGGGYQVSDTKLSLDAVGAGVFNGAFLDGLSGDGWTGDARLGFDWQVSGSPFVLGVLGGYNVGEVESEAGLPLIPGATATATLTPTWYVGGRVGIALPTHTLVYGGAAWQEAKGELGGVLSGSATEHGIMYIAGIEQVVAKGLTLGAEYSLAQYDFDASCGVACNVNIDPDVHAFKVRLNWRPFSK